jgi:hypothetical protein
LATSQGLQFEYRGQVSVLGSPADIAAWVAERRKRWPTAARREAAKKEAEEKRRKWEEEKRKRVDAVQVAKQKRIKGRLGNSSNKSSKPAIGKELVAQDEGSDPLVQAKLRAERLRRKALKAQHELEAAEKALISVEKTAGIDSNTAAAAPEAPTTESDNDSLGTVSDSSQLSDPDSESSSEPDSDTDSAPEATSSKIEVRQSQHPSRKGSFTRKPCQHFAKHGTCKFGQRCKYSHEQGLDSSKPSKTVSAASAHRRKTLWWVMVEKEQEEERTKVLQAIIALGKQGLLDGTP